MQADKYKMNETLRYLNSGDVEMRLSDGIVKYKGTYYVAFSLGMELALYPFSEGYKNGDHVASKGLVDSNNPDLDISAVEIGWVNETGNCCAYYSRVPFRKQKQVTSSVNTKKYYVGAGWVSVDSHWLYSPSVEKTLLGVFPPVKNFFSLADEVQSPSQGLAISKDFFIQAKTKKVYFQTTEIGELMSETKVKLFTEEYDSLLVHKLSEVGLSVD